MKKRLLLILLGLLGVSANLIAIPWLFVAIIFAPDGTRAWNIILGYDILGNATTGGAKGELISERAYKVSLEGRRWGCLLCKLLNWLDPGHCERSIRS